MKNLSHSRVITPLLALGLGLLFITACQESDFSGNGKIGATSVKEANAVPLPEEVYSPDESPVELPPANPAVEENTGLFQDCESSDSKFVADLFELPVGSSSVPDFATMTRVKETCLRQLDIVPRNFNEGFPGVDNLVEWFGLNINFVVTIKEEGEYNFRLKSDDGSIMTVDGVELINNDGLHEPISKEKRIFLTKGNHVFNIRYYQGPREAIALELFWKTPGSTVETYLPLELVSRP